MAYARILLLLARPGEEGAAEPLIEQLLEECRRMRGFREGYRITNRLGHGERWSGCITVWEDRASMDEAACSMTALPLHGRLSEIAEPRTLREIALEVDHVQPSEILDELQRVPAGLGEIEVQE